MKKFTLLALLVFSITLSNAQYVTIPDTNFRSFLKNKYPSCFNGQKLDTTCSTIVNETYLNCSNLGISSLSGIKYFKNLRTLICEDNSLSTLTNLPKSLIELQCSFNSSLSNISNLPDSLQILGCASNNILTNQLKLPKYLKELDCSFNSLTSLPTLPQSLISLKCNSNSLTNIPTLPSSLEELQCYKCQLTNLPALPNSLRILNCRQNAITNLPILPVDLISLDCSSNQLTSLPTMPNNLIYLLCASNLLTNLPTLPITLEQLFCQKNQLTSIPNFSKGLKVLICSSNQLIDLPPLGDSLQVFECDDNQLTNIPILPNTIKEFLCKNNQLSSLPTLPPLLWHIECDNNQLTSLPSLPNNLNFLYCTHNQLTSLPTLPDHLWDLVCSNNPISCLPILPEYLYTLSISSTNIVCIPNEINLGQYDTVLPLCTDPSDICGINTYAKGFIYDDINNNGVWDKITESIISEQIIRVEPNNWHSISDGNGQYLVKLDTAINNTWSCTPPKYATVNPDSYSFNPDTVGLIDGDYNFGIHFIPNIKDLVVAIGSTVARPGFTTNIAISVNNVGTTNQSNITVKLKKPNGYDVTATSITPTAISNDTLIWQNVSIDFLQSSNFYVELQVPINAVLGTTLLYEAWVNGTQGDTTPLNNYAKWKETVRGSYDPNDKLVSKTSLAPNYDVEKDRLIYTIRFQNTGTDTAFYVRVKDEIPDNLNISTLRVINASHDYQLIVREKNIVEFVFPNIFLPDSGTNEPKSHGFVQFAIQPKPGLPINTKIENNAAIYFDYNAPVITNFAITEVKLITGIANNKNLDFKLFPNPTNGQLTVDLPFTGNGFWILSDISGRQIEMSNIENGTKTFNLNLNDLPNGTYFLSIQLGNQVSTAKVMKL